MCPVFPPRSRNDDYDDDDDSTRVLRFLWLICGFHFYGLQAATRWEVGVSGYQILLVSGWDWDGLL